MGTFSKSDFIRLDKELTPLHYNLNKEFSEFRHLMNDDQELIDLKMKIVGHIQEYFKEKWYKPYSKTVISDLRSIECAKDEAMHWVIKIDDMR